MALKVKYDVDQDLGVDYADEGPWRSFQFTAEGNNLKELWDSACVSEVDQDGGDLRWYAIGEASNDCISAAATILEKLTGEKFCSDCEIEAAEKEREYQGLCECCATKRAESYENEEFEREPTEAELDGSDESGWSQTEIYINLK